MGKHPKLENLDRDFIKGKDFSLTDAQYEKEVGIPLPKGTDYLLNRSALARKCREMGYTMIVQEKTVIFRKEK